MKYEGCPVIKTLEAVGYLRRMTVIHVLSEGELRFNELTRATHPISQTQSRVLEDLEEKEYVEPQVDEEIPVVVFYPLTPKGNELFSAFDEIFEWGG